MSHLVKKQSTVFDSLVPSAALFVIATQIAIVHVPRHHRCVNAMSGLGILTGCTMHIYMNTCIYMRLYVCL